MAQYRRLSGEETQPLYRFLQAELPDEKTGRPPARAILSGLGQPGDRIPRATTGGGWSGVRALGRCYEADLGPDQGAGGPLAGRAGSTPTPCPSPGSPPPGCCGRGRPRRGGPASWNAAWPGGAEDPAMRVAMAAARLQQQAARPAASPRLGRVRPRPGPGRSKPRPANSFAAGDAGRPAGAGGRPAGGSSPVCSSGPPPGRTPATRQPGRAWAESLAPLTRPSPWTR